MAYFEVTTYDNNRERVTLAKFVYEYDALNFVKHVIKTLVTPMKMPKGYIIGEYTIREVDDGMFAFVHPEINGNSIYDIIVNDGRHESLRAFFISPIHAYLMASYIASVNSMDTQAHFLQHEQKVLFTLFMGEYNNAELELFTRNTRQLTRY